MKVFVTGANGHCGANTLRQLIDAGHDVIAMVRESADTVSIDGLDVEVRHGDVMDAAAVERQMAGADAIINHAAVFATRAKTAEEIMAPAIQGVENVLRAAAKHGIGRVVHTSSAVAIGSSSDPVERNEDDWNDFSRMPYYLAKTESERRAWELAETLGVELVCICPVGIIGRHSYRNTPMQQTVLNFARGKAMTSHGGFGLVDVRDVSAAHISALDRGQPGRYGLSGANLTMTGVANKLTAVTGRRIPHVPTPRAVALAFVRMSEFGSKLIGREPQVTYLEAFENAGRYLWCDSTKARENLDWAPHSIDDTIEDTLQWMLHRNELEGDLGATVRAALSEPPAF